MEGIQSDRTDSQLLAACLDGDERAWQALIARYKRLVYSVPIKLGIFPKDAANLFESVWQKCFQELESLKGLDNLHPWLIGVAIQKCQHFSNTSQVSEESLRDDATGSHPAESDAPRLIQEIEREETFRVAIQRLSPRCQTIIHNLFFEAPRADYSNISRLPVSEDSIRVEIEDCLKELRKAMENVS